MAEDEGKRLRNDLGFAVADLSYRESAVGAVRVEIGFADAASNLRPDEGEKFVARVRMRK